MLESVQQNFTRWISGLKDLNYWDRLQHLDLMSLQRRRERYIIIHTWKIINHLCPNDVGLVVNHNKRLGIKLFYPPVQASATAAASTAYENSFSVRAVKLWNTLPSHVNSKTTLSSFKSSLGVFLKKIPDKPPTVGYTSPNSNSLVDCTGHLGGQHFA